VKLVIDTGIDTGLCLKSKSCSGLAVFLMGSVAANRTWRRTYFKSSFGLPTSAVWRRAQASAL